MILRVCIRTIAYWVEGEGMGQGKKGKPYAKILTRIPILRIQI